MRLLAFLLLLTLPASGVILQWDTSPSPNVAGYRLRYGPSRRTYTNTTDMGMALRGGLSLPEGVLFVTVCAYNAKGVEADPSNEVVVTNAYVVRVDMAPNVAGPWTNVYSSISTNGPRFWRLTIGR